MHGVYVCNMHAYHRMNQCQRVTVCAGVLRAVCASGHIRTCISCSYTCGHWCWGLVHIQELKYLWLCVHIPPHRCTCCPFTSYDRASIYVFVYDQCCSHTTAACGLTHVQRGPEHIIYRKVYREINGQKSKNVCKTIFYTNTSQLSHLPMHALRATLVP